MRGKKQWTATEKQLILSRSFTRGNDIKRKWRHSCHASRLSLIPGEWHKKVFFKTIKCCFSLKDLKREFLIAKVLFFNIAVHWPKGDPKELRPRAMGNRFMSEAVFRSSISYHILRRQFLRTSTCKISRTLKEKVVTKTQEIFITSWQDKTTAFF